MNVSNADRISRVCCSCSHSWLAVIELNRRYFRQRKVDSKPLNTWVKLDSTFEDDVESSLPDEESDEEEDSEPEANIQIRAQHNGYHSESKKLF